jgi:hypothetical protein
MHKARGQILVLMAMLTTTLIIFFGMVVAVGHLVQARINLQNSVDFAAMVGASYQARFLNGISVVNYRLRQNYKFVLADLYVTQSRFNVGFKEEVLTGGGGVFDQVDAGAGKLVFGICQQYPGYAPNVEIAYGAEARAFPETDMCKFAGASSGIPHIMWTPIPSLNPIVQAINLANFALSEEIKKTCGDAAGQNEGYFKYIIDRLKARNAQQKELLEKMIAAFSGSFMTGNDLMTGGLLADGAVRQTFLDNLISANRSNPGGVKLEYINPPSTRAPPAGTGTSSLAYFEPQESSVMVRSVNFINKGAECVAEILDNRSGPLFLGVTRSRSTTGSNATLRQYLPPKVPLFIALKASVRPKLLFWPKELTPMLVAVGAAKPFGSRIGPPKFMSNLELTGNVNGVGGDNFANISFYPGDFPGQGNGIYGFGHKRILQALYDALPSKNSGQTTARPHIGNSPEFVNMALAPTLYEGLLWSIFPDPPDVYGRGPADIAMYPQDPPIISVLGLAGLTFAADYLLADRQTGAGASPSMWHHVDPRFGTKGEFRHASKPLFYADYVSVASAFNPNVFPPDAGEVSKFLGGAGGGSAGSLKGRSGYQIKLTSIPQLCEEMSSGDSGAIGSLGAMEPLCKKPYKVWY